MMELFQHINQFLNSHAGFLSLMAVVVGGIGIWVTVRIYRKKKQEEVQRLRDELAERERLKCVAWPTDTKEAIVKEYVLKEAIKRGGK